MELESLPEPFLLVFPHEKFVLPMRAQAIQNAQRPQEELNHLRGTRLVLSNGQILSIKSIERQSPIRSHFLSKALRSFSKTTPIKTELELFEEPTLDEFKDLIAIYVQFDRGSSQRFLLNEGPLENILENIKSARSYEEVFAQIGLPALEHCLNVI